MTKILESFPFLSFDPNGSKLKFREKFNENKKKKIVPASGESK